MEVSHRDLVKFYNHVLIYESMRSQGMTLSWLRKGLNLQGNTMATIIRPLLKVSEMLLFFRKFTLYNIFISLKMFMVLCVCMHACICVRVCMCVHLFCVPTSKRMHEVNCCAFSEVESKVLLRSSVMHSLYFHNVNNVLEF